MRMTHLWKGALGLTFWAFPGAAADTTETSALIPDTGSRWEASVSTGLGLIDGEVGWGVGVGLVRGGGIPTPFWMGLDLAFYRWDFGAARDPLKPFAFVPQSGGATLLQILPTFVWDMAIPGWPAVTPYVGISVGPAWYLASGDRRQGTVVTRHHETLMGLAGYLRPGIRAELAPQLCLNVESKFGLFRTRLIFMPQFALAWTL